MIKTAQEAYVAGRQAALEKLASPESVAALVLAQSPAFLANYLGMRHAVDAGNNNARMSAIGMAAPAGYGAAGLLLGAGLGRAYDSITGPADDGSASLPGTAYGAGLGGVLGYGYGLRRAYKRPGEM